MVNPRIGGGVAVSVDNADRLMQRLTMFPATVQKKIARSAARKAAKPLLAKAKQFAPVDTGTLRDSIKIRGLKRLKKNRGKVGVSVAVGKGWYLGKTFYAAFIEFGTNRMEAQPFLRPAAKAVRKEVRDVWRNEMHKALTLAVNDVKKIKRMGRTGGSVGKFRAALKESL